MFSFQKFLIKTKKLRKSLGGAYSPFLDFQRNELKYLIKTAKKTAIGEKYHFSDILMDFKKADDSFYHSFKKEVPVYDYDKISNEWWNRILKGEEDVAWPGKVKYFALSSGTSGASSKYIPITKDMMEAIKRTSLRQALTLPKYKLGPKIYTRSYLMLGGSTDLNYNGIYFSGDLSGITTGNLPYWFQSFFSKPPPDIIKNKNWGKKLDEITQNAKNWDIGIVAGVPAWVTILFEKIIKHYNVKHIHEVFPNFSIYVHGGVSMDPYKTGFEKLLGKPICYAETYLASEGFLGMQTQPNHDIRLVLDNGIFFEFIPFTDANFDSEGDMVDNPQTLMIHEVEENKEYALLISTCAGSWRYLIGDTIKFISKENAEIKIIGRTKHFLSLCGEHMSVDNMNNAIRLISNEFKMDIKEFTVAGRPEGNLFGHHWYIGTDQKVDNNLLRNKLDEKLQMLNDDYRTERGHALRSLTLEVLPTQVFYDWMKKHGKVGSQNKFPRVLKGDKLKDWVGFLNQK